MSFLKKCFVSCLISFFTASISFSVFSKELDPKMIEKRSAFIARLEQRAIGNPRIGRLYSSTVILLKKAFSGEAEKLNGRFLMTQLMKVDKMLLSSLKRRDLTEKDVKDLLIVVNLAFHLVDNLAGHADYYNLHDFRAVNLAYHLYEFALSRIETKDFAEYKLHPLSALYASKAFKKEVSGKETLLASQSCSGEVFIRNLTDFFGRAEGDRQLEPIIDEGVNVSWDHLTDMPANPLRDRIDISIENRASGTYLVSWSCSEENLQFILKGVGECSFDYVKKKLCHKKFELLHRDSRQVPDWQGISTPEGPDVPWGAPSPLPIPRIPRSPHAPRMSFFAVNKQASFFKRQVGIAQSKSVPQRDEYHFNYAMTELLRLNAELARQDRETSKRFDYNRMLRSLVRALNSRYERNYSVDSVFYEVELTDRIMGQLDSSINELRDNNVSLFCEEKDIELCDNKILQPTIYVEKDSTRLRLNRVVFHPLSLIKTYGKDISIEANGLVNPWVDTSGRLVKQMRPLGMVDPGKKHVQKSDHKKKDDRNCDINFIIKDGCETHHYYKFWYEGGAAPQKMIQKNPSESAGAIEFHVEGQISLNPLLVAKGGDGDKGFTGLPSPSCVKTNDGWKLENHLLIERDWFKLGEDRSYTKAVEQSRHKLKVANVRKGVAGDGANGGNGGSVAISRPYQDHLPLYVVNVDGGAGGRGGEPHSCGPGDNEMLKGGLGRQGSKGKIYETVYP